MNEPAYTIRNITAGEASARADALAELLLDAVDSGAGVNFVKPMTLAKAAGWWIGALDSHARGERMIFTAESASGAVDGTVQLMLAPQENQPFRADIGKMLVHRRARRRGLGALLLQAAEDEARRLGRTLLTLDTNTGGDAERLYIRMGWVKFGEVPGYSHHADHRERVAASFFYKELDPA